MAYLHDLTAYFDFGLDMLSGVLKYIISDGRELLVFIFLFPIVYLVVSLLKHLVS